MKILLEVKDAIYSLNKDRSRCAIGMDQACERSWFVLEARNLPWQREFGREGLSSSFRFTCIDECFCALQLGWKDDMTNLCCTSYRRYSLARLHKFDK
ncbi:synoviolin 1 isoform b, partial [Moniliophthora roreri]